MTPLDIEIAQIMLNYYINAKRQDKPIPPEAQGVILGFTVRILRKNGYNDIADVITKRVCSE